MAWDLDGVDNYVRFTMPTALQSAAGGPMTMAALVHLDSTADGATIHTMSGTTSFQFMEIFSTWNYGTTAGTRTGPAGATGAWYWVIISKDTGNVAPEYTIFPLATMTPTSGSITGGGVTLGNGTAPGASGFIQVGRWGTSATEYVNGRIAAVAIWTAFKNQAAREALTTWALTLASAGIAWAVRFDALTTRVDATGNGGGETARFGTSAITLAADPAGSFFGGTDATVTPSTVAGAGAVPAPSLSTGSRVTATAVAGVASVPAPTVSAGSRATPVAVAGVASIPAPTLSTGVNVTAATVAGAAAVPAVTFTSAASVTATAVAGVASIPAPTVAAGSTVAAATVAGAGAVPAPSVSAGGSAAINATAVLGAAAVPAPALATGATVTPAAVAAVGVVPSALVSVSAVITVTTVTGAAEVPTPMVIVSGGATIAPATVSGVAAVPPPGVSAGGSAPVPVLIHVKDRTPVAHIAAAPLVHERIRTLVHVGSG